MCNSIIGGGSTVASDVAGSIASILGAAFGSGKSNRPNHHTYDGYDQRPFSPQYHQESTYDLVYSDESIMQIFFYF